MADATSIKQKAVIPATPEQIFDALVNAKTHAKFTGAPASGAGKVGAKFTAWGGYISGKHLVLNRPSRIVQDWSTTEWPEGEPPSRLEFTFKAKGKRTEVTMVQTHIPPSQVKSYEKGWIDYYWTPLKKFFGGSAE